MVSFLLFYDIMKWFRSAEMEYISLILNEDAAHDCVQKLGQLGVIEFTDLNQELTPFQRRYVSYVRRCDEMERKIRYFQTELEKFNIATVENTDVHGFLKGTFDVQYGSKHTAMRALDSLEHILEEKESELMQLNSMHGKLSKEFQEKKELQAIIDKIGEFFAIELPEQEDIRRSSIKDNFSPLLDGEKGTNDEGLLRFRHITGIVAACDRQKFERMLFRTTRGNCYTKFSMVPTDEQDTDVEEKFAFVIFFQSEFLQEKLRKVCEAFHARLYTLPPVDDQQAISSLKQNNAVELKQSNHILQKNRESCVVLCRELAEHMQSWKWTVLQEKATYHTLNLFKADVSGMLRAEGWVIQSELASVKYEVTTSHASADQAMPSCVEQVSSRWPEPPTYFETNKFTESYQSFVDTYGVPRYREINPAVFTAVTFPFLFGVMYGDIGHGSCVMLAGLYMILTEDRMKQPMGEMLESIYGGRYMIFMMGAFGVYAGFVYNDFFALSLNLFGSKYEYDGCLHDAGNCVAQLTDGASRVDGSNVYPFGLDPIWKTSSNELLYFNSFKMKFAVVMGIIQMTFGICLKGWNSLYFKKYLDFFFEFIPQLIFTSALFIYMAFLIFLKWSMDFAGEYRDVRPAPLINTMINIVLSPFELLDENKLYDGQLQVQQCLGLAAFLMVPIMLLVKPIILNIQHKKEMNATAHHTSDAIESAPQQQQIACSHLDDHGEFAFGEIAIHQGIETIEFVLGMISNTASYLRLWALSLAHSGI